MLSTRIDFTTVVRITTYIFKFDKILISRIRDGATHFNVSDTTDAALRLGDDADVKKAEEYSFRKPTLEVKHFMKEKHYQKISVEKDCVDTLEAC